MSRYCPFNLTPHGSFRKLYVGLIGPTMMTTLCEPRLFVPIDHESRMAGGGGGYNCT